jgi:hypothetical protein
MPHCRITVVLPLLVLVISVSMLSAQTGGAMLYANGNAKVNGQAAGYSTSIFPVTRLMLPNPRRFRSIAVGRPWS